MSSTFLKLVGQKNDKIKFDKLLKTNEDNITVTHGYIRFVDSYRFLSNSFDSLVETIVEKKHQKYEKRNSWKWYKNSSIVIERETLNDEDRTIEELKKVFLDEIEKLEETLKITYLKLILQFPDRWKYLGKKSAYPYEYFTIIEDCPKSVDQIKRWFLQ